MSHAVEPTRVPTLNIEALRADTPGCAHCNHLNNAGAALMPEPVLRAMHEHLELEAHYGGYEAADLAADAIQDTYTAIADLLGAKARQIALVENATAAFGQALSSIPFEPGDVILTSRADYVSNQIMFLSLIRRFGVELVRAPDLPNADSATGQSTTGQSATGCVDPNAVEDLVRRHRPKLVAITHIPTYSGRIQDVTAIGAICRRHDVTFLLDACQSVGHLPLDIETLGCDFLSATGRKFLRGPRGTGFLYVSERALDLGFEPLLPDLRGADWTDPDNYRPQSDARRFENWEFSWASVRGLGAAVRYVLQHGCQRLSSRTLAMADLARRRLAAVPGVTLLEGAPDGTSNGVEQLGAILTLTVEGWQPEALVRELRQRSIHTSAALRTSAVIDYNERGISGALRVSPHYYNSESEIEALADTLAELHPF